MLKRIINTTVWALISLYIIIVILLHLPAIQGLIGSWTAHTLSESLGAKVDVGRVDLGFINRLIVDDVDIFDKKGKQLLKVSRVSVKIDILPLLEKRISISSVQIFGLNANLYKTTKQSETNFQFVIDALSGNDDKQTGTTDIQINSIIIRHGSVRYRCLSEKRTQGTLSTNDLHLKNISGHIVLNRLTNDSINIRVKKLSFEEQSGAKLKKLSLRLAANKSHMSLNELNIELPESRLCIDSAFVAYTFKEGKLHAPSLQFESKLIDSYLTPSDLAFCLPTLSAISNKIYCSADIHCIGGVVDISRFRIFESNGHFNLMSDIRHDLNSSTTNTSLNNVKLNTSGNSIKLLCDKLSKVDIPTVIYNLGDIEVIGNAKSINNLATAIAEINTDLGTAHIDISRDDNKTKANITADDINLKELFGKSKLGSGSAMLQIESDNKTISNIAVQGEISHIEYNNYTYKDINLDGTYIDGKATADINIDDTNVELHMTADADFNNGINISQLTADLDHISPSALNLTNKWPDTVFGLSLSANLHGKNITDAVGNVRISDFSMTTPDTYYAIDSLNINSRDIEGIRFIDINADFGDIHLAGDIHYNTLAESVVGLIKSKLPTIPWRINQKTSRNNNFSLSATINDTRWMNLLLGIPLEISLPMTVNGEMADKRGVLSLDCNIPSFTYDDANYKDATININTVDNTLLAAANIKKIATNGKVFAWKLNASAADNELNTELSINDDERHPLRGKLKTNTIFYNNAEGHATANINVGESYINIGDTTWRVRPSNIIYNKDCVEINNFSIQHRDQYITIAGRATKQQSDSILVDFKDVNVRYILDMVNFHSVEFDGYASGKAYVIGISGDEPDARAQLTVDRFLFENGRMGTLTADVHYNDSEQQIDIDAVADDGPDRKTVIQGYVSPERNYIDLGIDAHNTRIEFMESFCGSFMENVDARANGSVRVAGPLSTINLTGQLVADGELTISSLNTRYSLKNDTITFIPDEILFRRDTIYDARGHHGIVEGNVHHQHLTNLSYDLTITANNLLAYNTNANNGDSFYGTVYATGDCKISGRSGEVTMDIRVTSNPNSIIHYDVSSQNDLSTYEFIQWKPLTPQTTAANSDATTENGNNESDDNSNSPQMATDIRLDFLIECTPDLTLDVIMDRQSGDNIVLNGNGTLRATYYNKGTFDLFGNFIVDHGTYELTIRDIIKKDFTFADGGTINFSGDPFKAALDLKAMYVLNGVSLSDLNIGNSFKNNNVRVNCIMNIGGTPATPQVTFDLDMPTLSSDAKQMVASVINAEEEMNQQVLYLLTVGRFYTQGNNNSATGTTAQYSQASLAMQSILSGTISQQLNNILGNIINSSDWNFGANISTGTEGFNDAEYEGILSGRLLNNRLLINGEFGYRDNANATTSFIGDFDLRYLLFPNGNLSINVYNKTNDRYFTRNTLNTQGIGIIMKKDFNRLSELFKRKKSKTKNKEYQKEE